MKSVKAWIADLSNAVAVSLLPLSGYQRNQWASDVLLVRSRYQTRF
ncbi:hypothetical protein OH492_23195 [Vibrio chagasii]|nr:hypothetical protein [Vibrio chagasii]